MNLIDSLRGYDNVSQSNTSSGSEREPVLGDIKDSAFSSALLRENHGSVTEAKDLHGKNRQEDKLMSVAGILVADECAGELNPLDLTGTEEFFAGEEMLEGELEGLSLSTFEKINEFMKPVSDILDYAEEQALQETVSVVGSETEVFARPAVMQQSTVSPEPAGMEKSFAAKSAVSLEPADMEKSFTTNSVPVSDNHESVLHGVQEMFVQVKPETVSETITVKADQAVAENDSGFRQVSLSQNRNESVDAYKLENSDSLKILDVKYDKKGYQDSNAGTGAKQDSGGLLKSLAGKISAGMQRLQSQPQTQTQAQPGAVAASLRFAASVADAQTIKTVPQTGNIQTPGNIQNPMFANNMDLNQNMNNISATNTTASPESGGGVVSDKVETVQQIIYKLQDMLPLQDTGRGNRISVSFEVTNLGKMQMFLEQKENSLKVVIESDTNSGRQELMNQRDGMTQQLRAMGYKDVTLDFSSSNSEHKFAQQQEKNSPTGNEDIDNVKLAGSDKLDLEAILAMK
jgi:hypothetical protein